MSEGKLSIVMAQAFLFTKNPEDYAHKAHNSIPSESKVG